MALFLHFYTFLFFQPGELPVPKDSKDNQIFGNYTFSEFIAEKWFYLLAILFMVILLLVYFREQKKDQDDPNKPE